MDEEIPYKPSQIGKLHEAPETLPAPPDPNNCWKVFNYLKCLLVGCKQTLRALLLRAVLRPRLQRRDWRRGVGVASIHPIAAKGFSETHPYVANLATNPGFCRFPDE